MVYDVHMTTTQGTTVRLIKYGNETRNSIGLHPVTGAVEDRHPATRELWALWSGRNIIEGHFGASYGDVVVETPQARDRQRIFAKLGRIGYKGKHRNDRVETVTFPAVRMFEDIDPSDAPLSMYDIDENGMSHDIPIDSIDDDPCMYCGSNTGTCAAVCPWGGAA